MRTKRSGRCKAFSSVPENPPIAIVLMAVTVVAISSVALPAPTASGAVADRFGGNVDEFYVAPDPLPPGAPGDVIRVQDVNSDATSTTVRVMYHSRDARDRDRAVTGIVTYPNNAPPPPGGWPVISIAPGTTGLAAPCATSRSGSPAFTFGTAAVGVRTDYIGLGPVGETQPYLSRPSEGHSVIDAVRAARNLTETDAGTRWLAVGGSQGGHAAIAANELGEAYASELELLGTVSLAPASMLDRTYNPIDRIVTNIVGVMALYGAPSEHPEINPLDYVSPQTAAVADSVLATGCIGEIINAFLTVPPDQFYLHDPALTEPARSLVLANDVGNVAVEAPLLLVQGTADARVFVERTRDLYARLCSNGQHTEYTEYEGATHDDIGAYASTQISQWLNARLSGQTTTNSCETPTTTTSAPAQSPSTTAAGVRSGVMPTSPVVAAPRFTG